MMDATTPPPPWHSRYAREIAVILIIKFLVLFAIKMIWFDAPTTAVDGNALTSAHLFGSPPAPAPHSPFTKEP